MPKPVIMVDDLRVWPHAKRPFHRGSCHLTVDGESTDHIEALHAFADRIGLRRSWFQDKSRVPHYDLTPSKREAAIAAGAAEVDARTQARDRIARRTEEHTR